MSVTQLTVGTALLFIVSAIPFMLRFEFKRFSIALCVLWIAIIIYSYFTFQVKEALIFTLGTVVIFFFWLVCAQRAEDLCSSVARHLRHGPACLVGRHRWNGCRCIRCDLARDAEHIVENYKCASCGKVFAHDHIFENLKCQICGGYDQTKLVQFTHELCEAARQSARSMSTPQDKQRVKDIGESLWLAGNHGLMLDIHSEVAKHVGAGYARIIEMWWDGIGRWRG